MDVHCRTDSTGHEHDGERTLEQRVSLNIASRHLAKMYIAVFLSVFDVTEIFHID